MWYLASDAAVLLETGIQLYGLLLYVAPDVRLSAHACSAQALHGMLFEAFLALSWLLASLGESWVW